MNTSGTVLAVPPSPTRSRRRLVVGLLLSAILITMLWSFIRRKKEHGEVIQLRPLKPASDCSLLSSAALAEWPASAARLDDDRYLLCNYRAVQEVNLRTAAVHAVAPPPEVAHWNPTGLCVPSGPEGAVFVANYTGHDVLEMRLRGDHLDLVRRYTHAEMVSPENVALSADGRLLAVADYDGDRLLVFHRSGELAWSRPVGNAHGVTFSPYGIAVTGLRDRQLTLFDLDGKQLRQTGGYGWGEGKYLWPTCVTFADDHYLVSDAHTGRITLLDRSLTLVSWFGGNGPGAGLFNMPYALLAVGDKLLICDTYKHRLLLTDWSGRCCGILARRAEPVRWECLSRSEEYRELGYLDPHRRAPATVRGLGARTWTPGYGLFQLRDDEAKHAQSARLPGWTSLFNGQSAPYLCWCFPVERGGRRYLLLGHSEGHLLLVVDDRGRCSTAEVGEYLWRVNDGLFTNSGAPFDPIPVIAAAAGRFAEFDRLRQQGNDPIVAAGQVFWPQLSPAELRARIEGDFVTRAGKDFWKRWQSASTLEERQAAARDFDTAIQAMEEVWLQEVFWRNLVAPSGR